jgi:hypothetical protein
VSVRRRDDGSTVILDGNCPVEDAEPLLEFLQATPGADLDWRQCSHLHTAVLQVVLAGRPRLIGPCGDDWIERYVACKTL